MQHQLLPTEKYQRMIVRLKSQANFTDERLAKELHTQPRVVEKILAGKYFYSEMQSRLIKVFCGNCK